MRLRQQSRLGPSTVAATLSLWKPALSYTWKPPVSSQQLREMLAWQLRKVEPLPGPLTKCPEKNCFQKGSTTTSFGGKIHVDAPPPHAPRKTQRLPLTLQGQMPGCTPGLT